MIFDKCNGEEMLAFINEFLDKHDLHAKGFGRKIERGLREKLPERITDTREIENWLITNWNRF